MNASERAFVQKVKTFYRKNGRHDLPWRLTTDPYCIAVSEVMLQQTQVPRVLEKYKEFLTKFPTIRKLAAATLADVLRVWSGLGYNRRAKFLYQMAQTIVDDHKGIFPNTFEGLMSLPGIGSYTAGAIAAFAFNQPFPIIETNIRTVYIHHFFPNKKDISDKAILALVHKTIDTKHPREWYWALMDYGSYLKSQGNVVHRSSKHYTKQSRFEGSQRQVRGAVLRELSQGAQTISVLTKSTGFSLERIQPVIIDLMGEGMIAKQGQHYALATS